MIDVGVSAVVVTFNRKELLRTCLEAIASGTQKVARTLVVDNASTDGTSAMFGEGGQPTSSTLELLSLRHNTGGAGGFAAGLEQALQSGNDWVWMMDDDAEPCPDALEELMRIADDPKNVYGSLAVHDGTPSWTTTVLDPPLGAVQRAQDVPDRAEVEMLPLLGLLIHRDLVARIGLPEADFFIAADDAEYCLRARRAGARIILAGRSHIRHPKVPTQHIHVLGRDIVYLSLPPWKRYYDTRNRLLIARKYHGFKLFTQAVPGSFVRLFVALANEPHRWAQAHAFFAGLIDGLLGIKGKRHEKWGVRQ